jgi:hypothetical protein
MAKRKNLSNPFSTGGGGAHFEAHVQASFVVLMLTGGYAPCLPWWPITEIKLQGKIDGFETDDLIVVVENADDKERRKLLGQVKHSITIIPSSALFGEVIQAAWNDFNNPKVFVKGKDIIALITGPLNATDEKNVHWLLNQARHTGTVDEFYRKVKQANFSPSKSNEKLQVIQHHLKAANGGNEVSREELYDFLNHFYLLSYDLGNEFGVVLSLLHSHISQFQQQYPQQVWRSVVDIVQTWNQDAGTITPGKLPEDLREAFKQKAVMKMPKELMASQEIPKTNWAQHPDATYLALAVLIGAWNEKSKCDVEAITQLFGIGYDPWLQKAREILHHNDSPLSLKNGIWKVVNRVDLLSLLGYRILDPNLDLFKSVAVSVMKERDPAFVLPTEERYAAGINGKVLDYSHDLRKGIAEGLAIVGSQPDAYSNCSQNKADTTAILAIREIFAGADWVIWGSLNDLLPTLAEAAPNEFLYAIDKALHITPCPFDALFAQESSGVFGRNYLSGLLWALEGLAWDEQYLVRACVALGELASRDPGGQWANRPANSLITILLPWLPQTLASVDKRKVAVQTLLNECPDITWNLIIQLLPGQHQTSTGSYKSKWRKIIPDNWKAGVTHQEYWQQTSFYAELAVGVAGYNTARLSELIEHFDNLPKPAFDQLIQILASQPIFELPEDQRLLLWDHLTKFTNKHRRFSEAKWALPDELISRIENVAEQIAPRDPFNLYQHLFTDRDFDLYEDNGDWEEQRKILNARRDAAVTEIFQQNGVEGIIRFAEAVVSPGQVGHALGAIADDVFEQTLLPHFLDTANNKHKALVSGFIWRRYHINSWNWCDNIDKAGWTPEHIGTFLACVPFTKEAWDRASQWLQENQVEYWSRTEANAYQADDDLTIAIEKLLEHDRPHAAINCLYRMHYGKKPINVDQCVRALLVALSSGEPTYAMDRYHIVELIKFLQSEPSAAQEDLFRVEWAYLPLLDRHSEAAPKLLESRLASDSEFFCELISLIYRSKKEDQSLQEPSEELRTIATNAWQLLHEWKTPPGIQQDETFSAKHFNEWLQHVKTLCVKSGHLEVALIHIGEVLINTPPDPDGLWIHRAVATALNDRDADDMRNGFSTGIYNSRDFHWVDPTGKPEKELAEQFRRKAEDVENADFQRFAVTLRDLAMSYEREAKQIIDDDNNHDID